MEVETKKTRRSSSPQVQGEYISRHVTAPRGVLPASAAPGPIASSIGMLSLSPATVAVLRPVSFSLRPRRLLQHARPSARRTIYIRSRAGTMPHSKVVAVEELASPEAKWVKLKKCRWQDPEGTERLWEFAERPTRSSSGVDAVAILALLRSESDAFPPSTIIIEQFRPPVNSYVVELPAGLINEGEGAEETAIRELLEETGFKASGVVETSPLLVADPGMTSANMKLVTVDVPFPEKLEMPAQQLDPGEFITARIVELGKLRAELKEYEKKGFVIDARLDHLASGFELTKKLHQPKP
ncbi:NUDIX hydrolase domain-like protein [Trametes meyenii]|nr:NUDIX hydrolase domain-like protein [Trametes meyenii]